MKSDPSSLCPIFYVWEQRLLLQTVWEKSSGQKDRRTSAWQDRVSWQTKTRRTLCTIYCLCGPGPEPVCDVYSLQDSNLDSDVRSSKRHKTTRFPQFCFSALICCDLSDMVLTYVHVVLIFNALIGWRKDYRIWQRTFYKFLKIFICRPWIWILNRFQQKASWQRCLDCHLFFAPAVSFELHATKELLYKDIIYTRSCDFKKPKDKLSQQRVGRQGQLYYLEEKLWMWFACLPYIHFSPLCYVSCLPPATSCPPQKNSFITIN